MSIGTVEAVMDMHTEEKEYTYCQFEVDAKYIKIHFREYWLNLIFATEVISFLIEKDFLPEKMDHEKIKWNKGCFEITIDNPKKYTTEQIASILDKNFMVRTMREKEHHFK